MLWENTTKSYARKMLKQSPDAVATIKGRPQNPQINGTVSFYRTLRGTLVVADITGLPTNKMRCANSIFAFHIHEGKQCTGNEKDAFADAKTHYNPTDCPHPEHAGDLPPLFANNGSAWCAFVTNRFQIKDVMGRAVIIHSKTDDFKTQPSGDAGEKLACGIIKPFA